MESLRNALEPGPVPTRDKKKLGSLWGVGLGVAAFAALCIFIGSYRVQSLTNMAAEFAAVRHAGIGNDAKKAAIALQSVSDEQLKQISTSHQELTDIVADKYSDDAQAALDQLRKPDISAQKAETALAEFQRTQPEALRKIEYFGVTSKDLQAMVDRARIREAKAKAPAVPVADHPKKRSKHKKQGNGKHPNR